MRLGDGRDAPEWAERIRRGDAVVTSNEDDIRRVADAVRARLRIEAI